MDISVDAVPPHARIDATLVQAWGHVLEIMPDAVFVVAGGPHGGRILYLNTQALRMFGYARDEIIDRPIDMLLPAAVRARHALHRRRYAVNPQPRRMGGKLPLLGRRRDGSEFPIDVQLNPADHGPMPATIAVVRDMTVQKELEIALTRARDSAVQANAMKSRFLAAASHDLRQPLQTIAAMQAVLARDLDNAEYAPHVAMLEEAVRNMDQMLSALVDINRLEVGAIQPVIRDFPLKDILPRLRSEFAYAATSKSLGLEVADCGEHARSDVALLPVILRNLIGNAIKYTRQGCVRLRVRSTESHLHIDVIDSGAGISAEHLQRLFDDYYQVDNPTHDQRQGVGLGLSIVKTLCQLLDHGISVESRVGEGSTFTVQIPRGIQTGVAAAPAAAAAPASMRAGRAKKVLHIEDDPGVAQSMAMLLGLEGYEVISAGTRDEALQQIEVHALRPDLILSDFQLPMGFRGDEIVAEIAARLGFKPPTIMLTGDTSSRHVAKAKLAADRILPKPVDVNLLLREIEDLLGTRH